MLNPRDLQKAMRRMGIKQSEIDASEVVIKCADKEIVVSNPQVAKVNMMGQETFQISGDISERELEVSISEEDVKTVMEQTNVDKETALKAIRDSDGDLAAAILSLSE